MSEEAERLNQQVDRILDGDTAGDGAEQDPPLVQLAVGLHHALRPVPPAEAFRARLKAELLERYADNVRPFPAPMRAAPPRPSPWQRARHAGIALAAAAAACAAQVFGYDTLHRASNTHPASPVAQGFTATPTPPPATYTPAPTPAPTLRGQPGNDQSAPPPGHVTRPHRHVTPPVARPTVAHGDVAQNFSPTATDTLAPADTATAPPAPTATTPPAPGATQAATATIPAPTATPAPPTSTAVPPSRTAEPAATTTPIAQSSPTAGGSIRPLTSPTTPPDTATAAPTSTDTPPSPATPPATATVPAPTATPAPPTSTAVPPSRTAEPAPPSSTRIAQPSPTTPPATATAAPPSSTPDPSATRAPGATDTPVPAAPTATQPAPPATLVAQVSATAPPQSTHAFSAGARRPTPSATPTAAVQFPAPLPANAGGGSPLTNTVAYTPAQTLHASISLPPAPSAQLAVFPPVAGQGSAIDILQSLNLVPDRVLAQRHTLVTGVVHAGSHLYAATLQARSYGYHLTLQIEGAVPAAPAQATIDVVGYAGAFLNARGLGGVYQGPPVITQTGSSITVALTQQFSGYVLSGAQAALTFDTLGVLHAADVRWVNTAAAPLASSLGPDEALRQIAAGHGLLSSAGGVQPGAGSSVVGAAILYVPVNGQDGTYYEPVYQFACVTAGGTPFQVYMPAIAPMYLR